MNFREEFGEVFSQFGGFTQGFIDLYRSDVPNGLKSLQ